MYTAPVSDSEIKRDEAFYRNASNIGSSPPSCILTIPATHQSGLKAWWILLFILRNISQIPFNSRTYIFFYFISIQNLHGFWMLICFGLIIRLVKKLYKFATLLILELLWLSQVMILFRCTGKPLRVFQYFITSENRKYHCITSISTQGPHFKLHILLPFKLFSFLLRTLKKYRVNSLNIHLYH